MRYKIDVDDVPETIEADNLRDAIEKVNELIAIMELKWNT